jgi:hypothetical protein
VKSMLQRRLNIAPAAPRYSLLSWGVLAAGLVAVSCAGLLTLSRATTLDAAKGDEAIRKRAQEAHADAQRRAAALATGPAALAHAKARLELEQSAQVPWFTLFDALEHAARETQGAVSLQSLIPAGEAEALREVKLTAVATSPQAMLSYVAALRRDARLASAELVGHQVEPTVGGEGVRLLVVVRWSSQSGWVPLGKPQAGRAS